MDIIQDHVTRRTVTMDAHRAEAITSGFEQLDIQRDYGAEDCSWHMRQPRRGQRHAPTGVAGSAPSRPDADAALQVEGDRFVTTYFADHRA
jgi:hypothetical protein